MALTKKEVEHVARLARLAVTEAEKESLTAQLDSILGYMDKLKNIDTSHVPPTAHPFFTKSVWREDRMVPPEAQEKILNNAPDREEKFFKVNKVIE